ncbi:ABC transporter substrate-binding protein [Paludisphaera sp.]|uniref:ABC transporter substrate-binding protein n=1 Tax=Paludisphaera sp. TaxID=2017432 RepID=UPI00301DAE59
MTILASRRALAAASTLISLLVAAATAPGQDAARAQAIVTPDDPLASFPFDRITLPDDTVLLVEPVSPRPLPPTEPPKTKGAARAPETRFPRGGNVGLPGEPSKVEPYNPAEKKEEGPEEVITVHLASEAATGRGDVRDFKLRRSHIKKIEYFEDILLEEGERHAQARDFTRAFEHYLRVRQRDPNWPGLTDRVHALLFAEGRQALSDGDVSRGLRLLRELHARQADYPGLVDQIAAAYAGRIDRAIELGLYQEARRNLRELEDISADVRQARELREKLQGLAKARAGLVGSGSNAERLDALAEGLRIWPDLPDLRAEYEETFRVEPTLVAAVTDVPSPPGPWIRSPADARVARLLFRPILLDDSEEARKGERPGQLAEGIEATDLGRRLVVRVRAGIPWSDGSREVSALDVARSLVDRCDPRDPSKYQARWADLLDRARPLDERQVELQLKRPLLRASSWLDAPVGAAHAGADGRVVLSAKDRPLVGSGPFICHEATPDAIDLRAVADASGDASTAGVRRLREVRHASPAAAMAAFIWGDAALIDHVAPYQVAALAADPDVRVGVYARPAVHVIALDGRNPLLGNRTLRRAISYAIDRKGLLEERILRGSLTEAEMPADGVFPRGDSVDAPGVKPLEHNPVLAVALASLARGEMELEALKLRLEYPAIAEVEAVIPRLVAAFAQARITVEPVAVPPAKLESELRAGRRFDMAYRVLRCDEPTLDAGPMICPGYDAPPSANALASSASPRILQLLLRLEQAVDWPTARGLAVEIDRELRDELPVIPLWQTVDRYAWRSRLKGPAETTERLYDGIETWEIAPWIAKDPWSR